MELTVNEKNIVIKFEKYIYENGISNQCLVQLIELSFKYLNAETIQECADRLGKSYNGIKKTKEIVIIKNNKYVIDSY